MEEIKQTKKTITSIFETNDKVFKIIQELKAAHEEQGRRIHGLEGSFQGLEKRIREGDKEIRELESMVLDLGPNLKQAAKTIEINTGPLVEERRRSQYLGIVEGGRESDLQPADGCSNIPLRLDGNMTESTNITPEHKEQVTCIVPYISHNRTNRQPVTYTENSDVNSVDSQISYQNRKVEPFGNHGKAERCDSQNVYPLTEKPVNDASFKGKLTKIADDNRLHYQRKIEMNKRRNKQKVNGDKNEKSVMGNDLEGVPSNNTNRTKYEDMMNMKQEITRQGQGKSAGVDAELGTDLTRFALEETREFAMEQPDLTRHSTQHDGQQIMYATDRMLETSMDLTVAIQEMTDRANREILKGKSEKPKRGAGPQTVLCLDTSGSMEGAAFQEMISLTIKFVEGIQQISQVLDIQENIAVSTFGKKCGVPLHLTNQYDKVKEVLMSLKPEGPSPMLEGIHMALAACEGNGRNVSVAGISIGSRIILISDGKGTPDQWLLSGDNLDPYDPKAKILVDSNLITAGDLIRISGNTLYSVPVGDYTKGPLEQVTRLSGGEVIQSHELGRMVQFAQLQKMATTCVRKCIDLEQSVDHEPFLRAITGVDSTNPGEPNFDQTKMDILTLALKYLKRHEGRQVQDEKADFMKEINTYMPCIGTRVRRSPTWKWTTADHGGSGTVVGHLSTSQVVVLWDCGCRNAYNYTREIHDVSVVEEERKLAADLNIDVGCKVKRGKDWTFGNQDGGEGIVGVVFLVIPAGFVHVRWPNRSLKRYRFGADGRHEVELINRRPRNAATASTLPPKRRERSNTDGPSDARTEMSVEDMNLFNLVGARGGVNQLY